jgi:Fur family peroxide stress response transcriptional regulator
MEQIIRKHSRKRDAILDCLAGTKSHPSAEWIYRQLKPEIPDLSLGTVYRNLSAFRAEGTIQSIGTVDGLERFDYNTAPHAHFVCRCCGAVLDVDTVEVPTGLCREAASELQARVDGCGLIFTGVCRSCSGKGKN